MSNHCWTLAAVGLLAGSLAAQTPARAPGLYATFQTTMGEFTTVLFEKEAPVTVHNFESLEKGTKPWKDPKTGQMVKRPLFDGLTFHRVIPGFMIQGGDPAGNGTGDIGFTIKDEFVRTLTFAKPGMLAMANTGEPHTGACQFFITVAPTPHLNMHHTIFGQVVEGYDVVEKISKVRTGREDRPVVPVRITKIVFTREGPPPAAPAK